MWPRARVRRATTADKQRRERLVDTVTAVKWAPPEDIAQAMDATKGTPFLWRDLLTSQMTGHQIAPIELEGATIYPESFILQLLRALNTLGKGKTGPLTRWPDRWRAISAGTAGSVYTSQGVGQVPKWIP